jgi:Na+-translocating ferredoxin:NAD+ oxidoreductase RnfG subunit
MSQFLDQITRLPTPFNMVVLIVLIGAISGIITTLVKQIGALARQRQDLAFKRELIDRGMSAEEVQRVVESRSQPASSKPAAVHANQYFASEA